MLNENDRRIALAIKLNMLDAQESLKDFKRAELFDNVCFALGCVAVVIIYGSIYFGNLT